MSPCGRWDARGINVDGDERRPRSSRRPRPHGGFRRSDSLAAMDRRNRPAHPRTSSISASAAPTSARSWPTSLRHYGDPELGHALRLERRRHGLRRGDARPRSRRNAVHHLFEDVYHARNDDQRPHRPRLVPRRCGDEARSPSTSWRSRRTPRRSPSSGSTRRTCSGSGTGSAAATRWSLRSAYHDDRHRTRPFPRDARRLPRHGRTFPVRAVRKKSARADGADRLWNNDFFGAETIAVLPYDQYMKRSRPTSSN